MAALLPPLCSLQRQFVALADDVRPGRGHNFHCFCISPSASSAVARNADRRWAEGRAISRCGATNSYGASIRAWPSPETLMV
jgi:hypothetical protein